MSKLTKQETSAVAAFALGNAPASADVAELIRTNEHAAALYNVERQRAVDAHENQIRALSSDAVEVLKTLLQSDSETIRLRAAAEVVKIGQRLPTVDQRFSPDIIRSEREKEERNAFLLGL